MSRDALLEFRRELDAVQSRAARGLHPARMRAELARLERAERKAAKTLEAMRTRIREIQTLLSAGEDAA